MRTVNKTHIWSIQNNKKPNSIRTWHFKMNIQQTFPSFYIISFFKRYLTFWMPFLCKGRKHVKNASFYTFIQTLITCSVKKSFTNTHGKTLNINYKKRICLFLQLGDKNVYIFKLTTPFSVPNPLMRYTLITRVFSPIFDITLF